MPSQKNLMFNNTSRKNTNKYTQDETTFATMSEKNPILYYYPDIFEEHKEGRLETKFLCY